MLIYEIYSEALEKTPEKAAFICENDIVTYREIDLDIKKYINAFIRLGVKKGDRVSLFMYNRREIVGLYFALFRIGAIAVPFSCYCTTSEISYIVDNCGVKLIITNSDLYEKVKDLPGKLKTLDAIVLIDEIPGLEKISMKSILKDAELNNVELPSVDASEPALIIYTSGSTDRPKGVTHSQKSLFYSSYNRSKTFRHEDSHIFFTCGHLCHAAAFQISLLPMFYSGGSLICMKKFSSDIFLEMIQKYRPTHIAALPVQLQEILDNHECRKTDLSSILYFSCGGDTVPSRLFEKFREIFKLELRESIGMTECGGYMTNCPFEKSKPGALGKPIYGTQLRLIDSDGIDVPDGETGEVIVKTDSMMLGYWNDPENTARAIVNGWLHTGDLCFKDKEGHYYFAGRIKNIIVRGGGNVAPGEVEEALNKHPEIKYSGVTGVPDEKLGQSIHAFIVPRDINSPPSKEELESFAKQNLPFYKVPEYWTFLDSIPLTPMGKVDRKGLLETAKKYVKTLNTVK